MARFILQPACVYYLLIVLLAECNFMPFGGNLVLAQVSSPQGSFLPVSYAMVIFTKYPFIMAYIAKFLRVFCFGLFPDLANNSSPIVLWPDCFVA